VRGRAVRIRDVRDALRTYKIGYVPEDRKAEGLFLDQPVTRNIAVTVWDRIGARFTGVSQRREEELAATYVEQLGIRLASAEQLVGSCPAATSRRSAWPSGWPRAPRS